MSSTPVDRDAVARAEAVTGSLSPSRAADFKTCPLRYRLRAIDRLPEAPSRAATRGTLVHSALEALFDLPAAQRTVAAAQALIAPAWRQLLAQEPSLVALFGQHGVDEAGVGEVGIDEVGGDEVGGDEAGGGGSAELRSWLDSARALLTGYFTLEDPSRFEPVAREQLVEVVVDGLRLRGYIDRLDQSPAGELRIVDYKTGATPRADFQAKALFQMKFYALVLWRSRGVLPRELKLIYLADCDTLSYQPDEDELARFERTLQAIWRAIATASAAGDFRPRPSRLCSWCSYQDLCPTFGGTPPPFPDRATLPPPEPAPEARSEPTV